MSVKTAMARSYFTALMLLLLPVVVFVSGVWAMSTISGRRTVHDQKPLHGRRGYDTAAVAKYWGALDQPALRAEQRFLELDLLFPVFYGTSLAISLLTASAKLGRRNLSVWFTLPVIVTVLADWTENLVQLDQLRNYISAGKTALAADWIQVASTATILKLAFFSLSSLVLLTLLVVLIRRAKSTQ